MLHYVLQPRSDQHEGRVAVREGPDDPRSPPDFAVDALDPVARPDPAPVLRREFRAGQRLGEPVARRPRGRPAELRHAEFDFLDVLDEPSRVLAAVVGLPARRPLVARSALTSSDASSSRSASSDPSSTDAMFADAARAPFRRRFVFSRLKSYDGARAVFRYAVVNLRKELCVTSRGYSPSMSAFGCRVS